MPNGTLCGKAIVEMVLGAESEAPYEYVTRRLVQTGDLPQAYVVTKDRIERCSKLDSVQAQDDKWQVGVKALDDMMEAQAKSLV